MSRANTGAGAPMTATGHEAGVDSVGHVPRTPSTHRNLLTHLTAAVVVPGCIALCWWQVTRALSGNSLSWAYVFEWPIFAGYAVFMWWKLIHDEPAGTESARQDQVPNPPGDPGTPVDLDTQGDPGRSGDPDAPGDRDAEADEELASYNRYLAALNASGKRKQW